MSSETPGSPPREVPPDTEGTVVDLGDDLLEKTAILPLPGEIPVPVSASPSAASDSSSGAASTGDALGPLASGPAYSLFPESAGPTDSRVAASPADAPIEDVDDALESARILINEGFLEEAKRLLRRIVIRYPSQLLAKQRLEEIQQIELKRIFRDAPVLPRGAAKASAPATRPERPESVLRGLDRDLKLGLFEEIPELSLFGDEQAMEEFARKLDQQLAPQAPSDAIDLGIGFLEMGFADLAARQFRTARLDPERGIEASALLAWALLSGRRPFDAELEIERVLGDAELPEPTKIEFAYLMGRAQEELGRAAEARAWYEQVAALDPDYRDVRERVAELRGAPK